MALTKLNFGGKQQALVAANIPTLTSNKMPTGSVLQVVQETFSSQYYSASTSFLSTQLFKTITPQFSTSKILVSYSSAMHNNTGNQMTITDVFRDPTSSTDANTAISGGTALSGGLQYGLTQTYSQTAAIVETVHAQKLDSPNTTSEIKYVVAYKKLVVLHFLALTTPCLH